MRPPAKSVMFRAIVAVLGTRDSVDHSGSKQVRQCAHTRPSGGGTVRGVAGRVRERLAEAESRSATVPKPITYARRWLTVSLVLAGTLGAQELAMAGSIEGPPATEQSRTILAREARVTIAKAAREPTAAERRTFEYVKRHYSHAPAGTILVQSKEGEHWESPSPISEPDYDPDLSALDPRWAKGRKVIIFVTAHAFEYVLMRSLGINIPPTGPDPLLGGVLDKLTLAAGEAVGQWFYDRFPPSFGPPMGRPPSHSGPQTPSLEGDSGWQAPGEKWALEIWNEPREIVCTDKGLCIAEAFDSPTTSSHQSTYDPATRTRVDEFRRRVDDPKTGERVYEKETYIHEPRGITHRKWKYVHDAEKGAWVLRDATMDQRSILERVEETGPELGGLDRFGAETGNELTPEPEAALGRSMLSGGTKPGEHEVVDPARARTPERALHRAARSMLSEIAPSVERNLLKDIFESEGLTGHDPDDYELAPWYETQLSTSGVLGSNELRHLDAMAGVPGAHREPGIGGEGRELTPEAEQELLERILPPGKEPIDHEIVDVQGEGR